MPVPFSRKLPITVLASASSLILFGTFGCGTASGPSGVAPLTPAGRSISGSVHGGQQPVVGAQISLYAAGKTGLASAPRSMLMAPVFSNTSGGFSITSDYTCQAGDQVYLLATGGNSGSGINSAIELMAALGPCANLTPSTFINLNEVTTVASVYALAAFMTGPQNLGSDATNTQSTDTLIGAMANTATMVNVATGAALQTSTGNGVVPLTTINSLANSIAACINSTAANSATCTSLFSDTGVTGSTPNTLQAALNVAHSPAANAGAIFALAGATPPFLPTLTTAPAAYTIAVAHPSDVLTYHNNNARNGVQSAETTLTPASVSSATFGKLFSFPVDSYLFAQPLYVGGLGMPDGAVHDVLYAASTHATVYAFDADGKNPTAGYLWSVSLLPAGERFTTSSDYGCTNPNEAGIVGTPVIDRAAQTMYLVTKTINSTTSVYTQRLHALSLLDGTERAGSPVVIAPTFTGTGDGGTTITFNPQRQLNRGALALVPNASGTNTVYITFASHCDIQQYHGIVVGYDGTSLANNASFIDTPNGVEGGIWNSNGGVTADAQGYIYSVSGNGTFDANTNGTDYGDAVMKLAPPAAGAASNLMAVNQYFTPDNQAYLNDHDLDTGGIENLLFTDPASGVAPNLLVAGDKNGTIYLLNTAQLDGYDLGPSQGNGDLQDFTGGGTFIYNFAFFNNTLFTSTPLDAYTYTPGTSSTAGKLATTASAAVNITTAPVVSANGTANGIVWAQDTSGKFYAFNSAGLAELYDSTQAGSRDTPATWVKFTSPVIANGKVYLSGQGALTVYGLLN
jgi:hypothetical protein